MEDGYKDVGKTLTILALLANLPIQKIDNIVEIRIPKVKGH